MEPNDASEQPELSIDQAAAAVSELEDILIQSSERTAFDTFFARSRAFAESLRTDDTIGTHERGALEQHIREMCRRARIEYDRRQSDANAALGLAAERLTLANETLSDIHSIAEIEEVRADLRLVRAGMESTGGWASRDMQARIWQMWQRANETAWSALTTQWTENEHSLTRILDRAEAELQAGRPRAAKDAIKSFHDRAKTDPSSRTSLKTLRQRAKELWNTSSVASKEQHDAYLAIARRRLEHMRGLLRRNESTQREVESDIGRLQAALSEAQTDVAAALLRGQIDGRHKELRRLEAEFKALEERIRETEAVVV